MKWKEEKQTGWQGGGAVVGFALALALAVRFEIGGGVHVEDCI